MSVGLLGKKLGMSQIYDDQGVLHPVTVIEAGPCTVLQRKTATTDRYEAVQLGYGVRKEKNTTRAQLGHVRKAKGGDAKTKTDGFAFIREFRLGAGEGLKPGESVNATRFTVGQFVDVIGISKGKGFQGVVRRHRFAGGGAAHGSKTHRRPGAIGMRAWPGRIWKNARMGGHMGDTRITVQNLRVMQVREGENLLLVRGCVPGAPGSHLVIRPSIKGKKLVEKSTAKKPSAKKA
ncbi:MAG: 50S ribosomal protein L3 [Verrucomicrobiae bacterium]|nr:50S ribosomal protein L3 [Verrucomicrobiae bacterium]